jgi:hypothetical protein
VQRGSGGMADTLVLGASAERRMGSSPIYPIRGLVCTFSVIERYSLSPPGCDVANQAELTAYRPLGLMGRNAGEPPGEEQSSGVLSFLKHCEKGV